MPKTILLIGFIYLICVGVPSYATKLDLKTHDSLIEKLESAVRSNSKDGMILETNLIHRLADLYAERARLLAIDQEGSGEKIHKDLIKSDRNKSIGYLKQISTQLGTMEQGPVLLQMAHLYDLNGEGKKSEDIYFQIEKAGPLFDSQTRAIVEIHIADSAFENGNFKEAEAHFQRALNLDHNPRVGYCYFRLAWISFNTGQQQKAEAQLIELLKKNDLFKMKNGALDISFLEEASHDLATFMARTEITKSRIETLEKLSPESRKKANLIYLATELDRTSKKESAIKVWNIVGHQDLSFPDQLDKQTQLTRIQYELGNTSQLLLEIDKTIELLSNNQCNNNPECDVTKQSLKRVLGEWAKAENRNPSGELISSTGKYSSLFKDFDLAYWAAQAAKSKKMYLQSINFFGLALKCLNMHPKAESEQKLALENTLVGAIESAELLGDSKRKIESYKNYIKLLPRGKQANPIKYKIAHWFYEEKQYEKASEEFQKLAFDVDLNMDLRIKAADLCLDSDVITKNDSHLENISLEFSKMIPLRKNEYLTIWRKSIFNQVARSLQDPTCSACRDQLTKLAKIPTADATKLDQIQITKFKLELSFRINDIDAVQKFAKELLAFPMLSLEDRDLAFKHLAWIAELRLHFYDALQLVKKLHPQKKHQDEHDLKIAFLQELSGENPTLAYRNFLTVSKNRNQRQYAAHQIVMYSKNPRKDFKNFESELSKNSKLFRSAGIYAFEKSQDANLAKSLLANRDFRNSTEGYFIQHQFELKDFDFLKSRLSKFQIDRTQMSNLTNRLFQRRKLIKQLEDRSNHAIARQDLVLMLIYLSRTSLEYKRLISELNELPMPKNLNKRSSEQYRAQLTSLLQPFEKQSIQIQNKLTELWNEADRKQSFAELLAWSTQKSRPGQTFAYNEIFRLKVAIAETDISINTFEKLSESRQKTFSEIADLKKRIQENPFNPNDLDKMKTLHKALGDGPMVAYMDLRLNDLKNHGGGQ